jgi:hypothetical protein
VVSHVLEVRSGCISVGQVARENDAVLALGVGYCVPVKGQNHLANNIALRGVGGGVLSKNRLWI